MTFRRCNSPDHPVEADRWHDKREPCPHCGGESIFNKHLASSLLNSHLHGQAERQRKEVGFVKKALSE